MTVNAAADAASVPTTARNGDARPFNMVLAVCALQAAYDAMRCPLEAGTSDPRGWRPATPTRTHSH